jgi:hypothetical protein
MLTATFLIGLVVGFGLATFAGYVLQPLSLSLSLLRWRLTIAPCLPFSVHINFAVQNLTTIESLEKKYTRVESQSRPEVGKKPNPFDVGNYRNFIQVFGANPLLWFVPIFTTLGDGCHFQTAMYVELDTVTFGKESTDSSSIVVHRHDDDDDDDGDGDGGGERFMQGSELHSDEQHHDIDSESADNQLTHLTSMELLSV